MICGTPEVGINTFECQVPEESQDGYLTRAVGGEESSRRAGRGGRWLDLILQAAVRVLILALPPLGPFLTFRSDN
jgi:hypothetical protein